MILHKPNCTPRNTQNNYNAARWKSLEQGFYLSNIVGFNIFRIWNLPRRTLVLSKPYKMLNWRCLISIVFSNAYKRKTLKTLFNRYLFIYFCPEKEPADTVMVGAFAINSCLLSTIVSCENVRSRKDDGISSRDEPWERILKSSNG